MSRHRCFILVLALLMGCSARSARNPEWARSDAPSTSWSPTQVEPSGLQRSSGLAAGSTVIATPRVAFLDPRPDGIVLQPFQVDNEGSLRGLMRYLAEASSFNVLVDQEAEEAAADADVSFTFGFQRPVRLASALDLVVELAEGTVAWTVRDGVVYVTTPEKARGPGKTRVYDVADLTAGIADFTSQDVGDLRRRDDRPGYGEPRVAERTPRYSEEALIELIQSQIARETGRDDVEVRIVNGRLVVTY